MPPKRSTRANTEISNISNSENVNSYVELEQNQWICIINECALEETPDSQNKPTACKLRHPKSDQGAMFLFTHENKKVYEVTKFKEEFRSWLIENTVQSDGSILITTPVDPIFLTLPYLMQTEKSGRYMTIDQIIHDEDFPECTRLLSTSGLSELHQVTEIRGAEDLQAYKFDRQKTLSWLKLKIERVTDVLMQKGVCVSGAKSATYIATKKEKDLDKEDYFAYAYGMVSDYLPDSLITDLREYMGIPVVEKRPTEMDNAPAAKRVKLEKGEPTEDYSKSNGHGDSKTKKVSKLTTAQKQLSKVDRSGMKNISSFFSPKSKS